MKYAFIQRHRSVWPISVQCRVLGVSIYGQRFKTRREAKDETIAWLLWYNRTRLHSTLAYISPVQFEQNWLATQPKQANS